jgi:hypothetical protein
MQMALRSLALCLALLSAGPVLAKSHQQKRRVNVARPHAVHIRGYSVKRGKIVKAQKDTARPRPAH